MPILHAKNIVKSYKKRTVVNDVSFEVKSGEVVGLLGPNGAGKTTSFYMVVGLVAVDGGQIFLDDEDISDKKEKCSFVSSLSSNHLSILNYS